MGHLVGGCYVTCRVRDTCEVARDEINKTLKALLETQTTVTNNGGNASEELASFSHSVVYDAREAVWNL
jgi:hypothetical protein